MGDSLSYTISWGDGTANSTGTLSGMGSGYVVELSAQHTYNAAGNFTATLTLTGAGGTVTQSLSVNVQPLDITVPTSPDALDETQQGTFTFTAPIEMMSWSVQWGDGMTDSPGSGSSVSAQHTYADDNPTSTSQDQYTVTVTAERNGHSVTKTFQVTVHNIKSTISNSRLVDSSNNAVGNVLQNDMVRLLADVLDPAAMDTQNYAIVWGDGSPPTTGTATAGTGTASLEAQHVYSQTGTFTVELRVWDDDTNPVEAELWTGTVTVLPLVWIETVDSYAAEDGPDSGMIRIHRSSSAGSLTVTYEVDGVSTATNGADFPWLPGTSSASPNTGTVAFADGESHKDITITPVDEFDDEGEETIQIRLAGGQNLYGINPFAAAAAVQIANNPPTDVEITAVDAMASETGPDTGTFQLKRSKTNGALTVYYKVNAAGQNTAVAENGADFVYLLGTSGSNLVFGSVQFANGADTATITVTPIDDSFQEPTETVRVDLIAVSPPAAQAYRLTAGKTFAEVQITDDDNLPKVTVRALDENIAEGPGKWDSDGNEIPTVGKFRFTRSSTAGNTPLTVQYTTSGTATSGMDYAALPLTVTFGATSLTADVEVAAIDDSDANEGREYVQVAITAGPAYQLAGGANDRINILDNDVTPVAKDDFYSVSVGESVTISYQQVGPGKKFPWFELPIENDEWGNDDGHRIGEIQIVQWPQHGSISDAPSEFSNQGEFKGNFGLTFTYTPNGQPGFDSFTYRFRVGSQWSNIATVNVSVDFQSGIHYWKYGYDDVVRYNVDAGLLLVGGGGEPAGSWDWFVNHADHGDIVFLTITSGPAYAQEMWSGYGGAGGMVNSATVLSFEFYANIAPNDPNAQQKEAANAQARNAANSPFVQAILQGAEGIFIGGGNQWGYIQCWDDTAVETIIENRFSAKEIVLGGTSAGLAVLGQYDHEGVRPASVTSVEALGNPASPDITVSNRLFANIGPLAGVITDTHFHDRDRMGRLLTFMALSGAGKGLGVDEGTAVAVECEGADDGMAQVFGQYAYFVSNAVATLTPITTGKPLDYRNLRVRRMGAGVQFVFAEAWGAQQAPGDLYYIDAVNGVLVPHPGSDTIY